MNLLHGKREILIFYMENLNFKESFKDSLLSKPKISSLLPKEAFLSEVYSFKEALFRSNCFSFYSGGTILAINSWSYDIKGLDCFLLIHTLSGTGKAVIDSRAISLSPDTFLLMDLNHHLKIDLIQSPWKYEVLFFDHADADNILSFLSDDCFYIFESKAKSEYAFLLKNILFTLSEQTKTALFKAGDCLNHFLYLLLSSRIKENSCECKLPSYLRKVRTYLEDNYSEYISLDALEALFGVSKYRIVHEFKKFYLVSPIQFLNNRRMEVAKHLLESTDLYVHEIGSRVGIDNTNHFITLFKKKTGLTPAEYRLKTK